MPDIEYTIMWEDKNVKQIRLLYSQRTVDRLLNQLKELGITEVRIKERKLKDNK